MAKILLYETDSALRDDLVALLEREGYIAHVTADFALLRTALEGERYSALLYSVEDPEDLTAFQKLCQQQSGQPLILTRSLSTEIPLSVRFKAFDYLEKPYSRDEILHAIHRAVAYEETRREKERLQSEIKYYRQRVKQEGVEHSRALVSAASLYQRLRGAVPLPIFEIDERGGIEELNPAAERLVQQQSTEIGSLFDLAKPAEKKRLQTGIRRLITMQGDCLLRLPLKLKNHTPASVSLLAMPGEPAHFLALVAIQPPNAVPESRLRSLNRMKSLGLMATGLVHDLNNLLSMLSMELEDLGAALPDNDSMVPRLSELADSAVGGSRLIKRLLDLVRSDAREMEALDLTGIVEGIRPILTPLIRGRCTLETSLTRPLPQILGIHDQLAQALINLILNAREAISESGTITLATTTHPEFAFAGGETSPAVSLTVKDDGCGIPDELQQRIFEPGFTARQKGGGNGIGLALVRQIVEEHRGQIEVRSKVGSGTEFELIFPVKKQ